MDVFEAIVLGIIQGLTEWLPVSSSGHLVIAQEILGLPANENLLFDLCVHFGTLMAVVVFYRREIGRIVRAFMTPKDKRGAQEHALRVLGGLLLLATMPIALVGLLLSDYIDDVFTIGLVGAALIANAAILLAAQWSSARGTRRNVRAKDALAIGAFQAVATLPGISRSGSTISMGMFAGLEKEMAATFSFLLSVPTLAGAFAYGVATLETYDTDLLTVVVGTAVAFVTGLASIEYLLRAVRSGKLWVFSVYCALVGIAVIAYTL